MQREVARRLWQSPGALRGSLWGVRMWTSEAGEDIELLRKRLRYQSTQRGMKENNLLFNGFAEKELKGMGPEDLRHFERLCDAPDPDLFNWMTGKVPVPKELQTPLMSRLQAFAMSNPLAYKVTGWTQYEPRD
mmetsp:Transcript_19338/g.74270  ORF Transcript_19338/g.74270 Transcript_19338/m.74270 type:complete len:133 (+) Transcript_19338:43-441(+)